MKTKVETNTYPNGQKRYEIPYVNGQEHGLFTSWYPNGQKWHEIPFFNGKRHGIEIYWYSDGQKMYEIPCVNGQVHGVVTWRHSDGSLSNVQKWNQGQKVWKMNLYSKEQIFEDAEVELFFHETPELK